MITVTDEPAGTLVRVDGWLAGEGIVELERVLSAAAVPARLLVQDLRGADAGGLALLRRLADQGTPLDGLSPYIQMKLDSPAGLSQRSEPSIRRSETPVRSNEQ